MARCLILLSAACGVGKSTVKNALNEMGLLPDFACIDSDEVRLNWWNYKGTPREKDYTRDCLARAFELAGDKHLLFGTCNDPLSFFERVPLPEDVTATYVGMVCSDSEVRRRLLARPPERMCGEESFILSQIELPVLVEPTLTEEQMRSVHAIASGIERIKSSSAGVIPLETIAE